MGIVVCPLSRVPDVVSTWKPGRVVSLLDPEMASPDFGPTYADRHLRLSFHDAHTPRGGIVVPARHHVDELLAFVDRWDRETPLLIHCRAGIGRSPAAAFVAACAVNPDTDPHDIAVELRRAAPLARPNQTLVALGDDALGRGSQMKDAIAETGRHLSWIDVNENVPFEIPARY